MQVLIVICEIYVIQLTYGVKHIQITTWQKEKGTLKEINYFVQRLYF